MNQAKYPTDNQSSPRSFAKSKRVTYEVTFEIEFTRKKKMTSSLQQKKIRKSDAIQSMTEDIAPTNQTLLCGNDPNKVSVQR